MITTALLEHQRLFARLHEIEPQIEAGLSVLLNCLRTGGKIMLCGNGGSAADCQHFAAELVGKWRDPRRPLPAIALTTDSSILTAVANDFGYDEVFARQVLATGAPGDVLTAISTSGKSSNVNRAVLAADVMKMKVVYLTGEYPLGISHGTTVVDVPSTDTARIQEAHAFILHYWAEEIDKWASRWLASGMIGRIDGFRLIETQR